jgi:hypothetical protein
MSNVVKLFHGRAKPGQRLPKPVLCNDCDEPIEAARLQACANNILKCTRCISCASASEKRLNRDLAATRANQTIQIIR